MQTDFKIYLLLSNYHLTLFPDVFLEVEYVLN